MFSQQNIHVSMRNQKNTSSGGSCFCPGRVKTFFFFSRASLESFFFLIESSSGVWLEIYTSIKTSEFLDIFNIGMHHKGVMECENIYSLIEIYPYLQQPYKICVHHIPFEKRVAQKHNFKKSICLLYITI